MVEKKLVEVELVVVDCKPVKFWRVDEPYDSKVAEVMAPVEMLPKVPVVAKRLVLLAVPVKKLVEVLFVVVPCKPVKFCKVDELSTSKLVVVDCPETVRPVPWVPPPIVEEDTERMPLEKIIKEVVADWPTLGCVKGSLPQAVPVLESNPAALN